MITVNTLKKIVKNKDLYGLSLFCSTNIRFSFGNPRGWEGFVKDWHLDDHPEKSKLWQTLEFALNNGGTYDTEKQIYTAPYWFDSMEMPDELNDERDYTSYQLIAGKNVNIRHSPSPDSEVIAQLSYEVVYIIEETKIEEKVSGENYPWVKIKMADGNEGYVFGKYLYHPLDYRALFKIEDNIWKMTAFVAGD
ncbi:MAG: SH3 domain-containing protein [Brevinematales bacterium]|nr:SH3 domain-containing protein [Brevinematales bacterium]